MIFLGVKMENQNKKIYIVLSQTYSSISKAIHFFTHDKYCHASIAFDKNCKEMYSFGRKYTHFPFYGIFKEEDLNKGLFKKKKAILAIYELEVTKDQYDEIRKKVKEIKDTNKGYNIAGLLLAYFKIKLHRNKYYCSEFVYEVLSSDNVNILDKNKILFRPEELVNNDNINKVFEGKVIDFVNS